MAKAASQAPEMDLRVPGAPSKARLWRACAAAAMPNDSSPRATRVSRSIFLWRGRKYPFHASQVWSALAFPSHVGRLFGKELA